MPYSRLRWNHSSSEEPTEILSEYDQEGWERRKVEVFPDGTLSFADASETSGGTRLSLIPRPPDEEVVAEPEFEVFDLTQEEFERSWAKARQVTPQSPPRASVY